MIDPILRRHAVEAMTGLTRSSIYDLMARGEFPKPIKLTDKAVGWRESTIENWIQSREKVTLDRHATRSNMHS